MLPSAQKPKKVLFLITKSNWGGAQRYVYDLATNLDRQQFEPIVALGGDGTLATMLENAGVPVIHLKQLQNTTSFRQTWAALTELKQILATAKPDVLHLNSSVAGLLGALVGRLDRRPRIIFTAHGWAFNEDRPLWQRLIIKPLHYLTVLLSHQTIAVSRAIVTQMNWPGAEKKMKVINPGRSIGVMFPRADAREKIADFFPSVSAYQNDPWLVCVAELHPIKRHEILFAAVQKLVSTQPNARLLCFGEGAIRTTLEAWVATHGLAKHIFILGNLHEAARFLKAFDVFVLASKSESYGYVLHEAGLAGVPIVATNVGGIPDIVTNHSTGLLVPPDDVSALGKALSLALTSPSPCPQYSDRLQTELQNRTVDKMTRRTASLYSH